MKLKSAVLLSCLFFLVAACQKETNQSSDDPQTQSTLIQALNAQPDLKIMVEALGSTGLDQDLPENGYTLLVPTDAAFRAYFQGLQVNGVSDWLNLVGETMGRNILKYHMIEAPVPAQAFRSSFVPTRALSPRGRPLSLYTSRMDTTVHFNNKSVRIVKSNLAVDKAMIHKVDGVLALPSLTTLLESDPSYSTFRQLLQRASGQVSTQLHQDNQQFTLFLPTNTAFQDFFGSLNNSTLSSFLQSQHPDELKDRALYHLLPQDYSTSQLSSGNYNTMLSGHSLSVIKDNKGHITITDALGIKADLTWGDITAMNGSIHNIDYVLSPQ